MRLTLLGTGNAGGMPVYGCQCQRCMHVKDEPSLRRGPSCALLEVAGKQYLLDAGRTDIGERFPAGSLDGIFLTHFHVDHVQGLFPLRWGRNTTIPVYCPPDSRGSDDLYKHPGILDFQPLKKFTDLRLGELSVTPLPLIHSRVSFGYLFEYRGQRIAYLTDTKGLPLRSMACLDRNPLDLMIIDTCYPPGTVNTNHNNLDETLAIHELLKPTRTVLTHIGHDMDIWLSEYHHVLPETVTVGYDELPVYPY